MIDTIEIMQEFGSYQEIENCIQILEQRYSVDRSFRITSDNTKAPKEFLTCWDNGFKIWISQNKIYIQGSLTKLYFGDNIHMLNRRQLIKAYDILRETYDFIDWNQAIHKRIDLGVSLRLSNPASFVIKKIIGGDRMKKTTYKSNGESVIIGNGSHQIIFYDQTESCKKERYNLSPDNHIPDNLLRIEYKILKSYPMEKHFRTKKVTIDYILENMELLPKIWYDTYCKIEKDYSTSIGLVCNKKQLEMKAILHYGIEPLKMIVNESYKAHLISKSTKQNIQRSLSDILNYQARYAESINLIKELDNRVERFVNSNSFVRIGILV